MLIGSQSSSPSHSASPHQVPCGQPVGNRLSAALVRDEYERFAPYLLKFYNLQPVHLELSEILFAEGNAMHSGYFPIDSIISLLTELDEHTDIEAGMMGRETI